MSHLTYVVSTRIARENARDQPFRDLLNEAKPCRYRGVSETPRENWSKSDSVWQQLTFYAAKGALDLRHLSAPAALKERFGTRSSKGASLQCSLIAQQD
jgi:hypothetical protein